MEKERIVLKEELESNDLVMLYLSATWCGPCKIMSPIVDAIKKEEDICVIHKLDIEEYTKEAELLSVRSIPTFIIFKDGIEVHRWTGSKQKQDIITLIDSFK